MRLIAARVDSDPLDVRSTSVMGRHRRSAEWIQILPPDIPYTRELGVWMAVLRQAIIDYSAKKPGFYQRQAARWFRSPEFHPGSFRWVCDALELNVDQFMQVLDSNPKMLLEQINRIDSLKNRNL